MLPHWKGIIPHVKTALVTSRVRYFLFRGSHTNYASYTRPPSQYIKEMELCRQCSHPFFFHGPPLTGHATRLEMKTGCDLLWTEFIIVGDLPERKITIAHCFSHRKNLLSKVTLCHTFQIRNFEKFEI